MTRAAGLAAEISRELGVQPELIQGGGVFDVAAEGSLIFSRHREGRYPDAEEIVRALRKIETGER